MQAIIDFLLQPEILALIATNIAGLFGYVSQKTKKNQLAEVIDKTALKNNDFLELALKHGLTMAAKEIKKISK